MKLKKSYLPILALVMSPLAANATLITATNSGWYQSSGGSNGMVNNTCAGCGNNLRNWLGFDLSSLSGAVTSATLSIYSNASNNSGQTINWWDVSSSYSLLGTTSSSIFNDLGTGTLLANGVQTAGVYNNFVLNANGLADLTSALGGFWAIGGVNATGGAAFGYNGGVSTSTSYYQLNIETSTVPEPNTLALMLAALGLVGFASRRRQH